MNTKTNIFIFLILLVVLLSIGGVFLNWVSVEKKIRARRQGLTVNVPKDNNADIFEGELQADSIISMIVLDKSTKKFNLKDISGTNATGVAYILEKEGKFYHLVTASLPDIKENYFYQGWLVKKGTVTNYLSTGEMIKDYNRWILEFVSINNNSDYDQVLVTLEKNRDNKPEKKILEGTIN